MLWCFLAFVGFKLRRSGTELHAALKAQLEAPTRWRVMSIQATANPESLIPSVCSCVFPRSICLPGARCSRCLLLRSARLHRTHCCQA